MKKRTLILSVLMTATLLTASLTGCGNGKAEEASNGTESTGAGESAEAGSDNEVEFWNFFTGPDGNNMKVLVDGFNSTNPKYRIKNVTMASGDLYTKIPTVVNSGKGIPDLTIVDVSRIPMFYGQNLLESMDPVMAAVPEIKKENYKAAVWDTGTFDGSQYAIPLDMGVIGVAYNKDLVEKYAPGVLDDNLITIEEIKAVIPAASADGIVTIPVSFFGYEQALSLALSEGSTIFKEDNVPNINTPEFAKAIQSLKDIIDLGGSSSEGEDNLQLFMAGQSIFCPDGVWDANALNQIETLNWGLTSSLCYTADSFYNFSNSNQFVMLDSESRSEEKIKVIADFIDYVRVNSLEWAKSGQVPASNAADTNEEYAAMNQHFFVSDPAIEESIRFKNNTYTGYADDAILKIFGEILYGHISMEEGLAQAQKQVEDNIAQSSN